MQNFSFDFLDSAATTATPSTAATNSSSSATTWSTSPQAFDFDKRTNVGGSGNV